MTLGVFQFPRMNVCLLVDLISRVLALYNLLNQSLSPEILLCSTVGPKYAHLLKWILPCTVEICCINVDGMHRPKVLTQLSHCPSSNSFKQVVGFGMQRPQPA